MLLRGKSDLFDFTAVEFLDGLGQMALDCLLVGAKQLQCVIGHLDGARADGFAILVTKGGREGFGHPFNQLIQDLLEHGRTPVGWD